MILWVLIAILIALILIGFLTFLLVKKKRRPIDYYSWFIIGIIWIPIGIATGNHFLWILGLAFIIVSLINKDKWEKNRRIWKNIDKNERRLMIIIAVILGFLVAAGIVLLLSNKI